MTNPVYLPSVERSFSTWLCVIRGPGSVVSIATGYGLDGRGIESRWGARFSAPVQTGPGAHPASCTMGTGSFSGVKSGRGVDADPSPPSSAVGHERVELYLYSPYGPYGLYRASVPVQGCTLPLPYVSYFIFTRSVQLISILQYFPLTVFKPFSHRAGCWYSH